MLLAVYNIFSYNIIPFSYKYNSQVIATLSTLSTNNSLSLTASNLIINGVSDSDKKTQQNQPNRPPETSHAALASPLHHNRFRFRFRSRLRRQPPTHAVRRNPSRLRRLRTPPIHHSDAVSQPTGVRFVTQQSGRRIRIPNHRRINHPLRCQFLQKIGQGFGSK